MSRKNLIMLSLLALLISVFSLPPTLAQTPQANGGFINQLAERTYAYLSSDWATSNHLPWSWRSEDVALTGGDYANTTEIGLLMLAHLAAYDMAETWSPDWATVEAEVMAVLDQLRAWQTGSQVSQPHGPNAYDNSVFYQWYWISWNPPVVGNGGDTHLVPSIDNAFLATSLIVIRAYAEQHNHTQMAATADAILDDMDFTLWYNPTTHRFTWGAIDDPAGGTVADLLSNENRLINHTARALGHLTSQEYLLSLDALTQNPALYDRDTDKTTDDIVVNRVAWDGSFFTYMAPGLFSDEGSTAYAHDTLLPATWAQIAYALDSGYEAWGLSECYDVEDGDYVQQGAEPAPSGNPETRPGLVSPHASAMALVTAYETEARANLAGLAALIPDAYHAQYGFYDCMNVNPLSADYLKFSSRFSALNQEWLFLSIVNMKTNFIREYFYLDAGVQTAHEEYEAWLSDTAHLPNGGFEDDAKLKPGSTTDYVAKGAPWKFAGTGNKVICDRDGNSSGAIGDNPKDKIFAFGGFCAARVKRPGNLNQTVNMDGALLQGDGLHLALYAAASQKTNNRFQVIVLLTSSTDGNGDGKLDKHKQTRSITFKDQKYHPVSMMLDTPFDVKSVKVQVNGPGSGNIFVDDAKLAVLPPPSPALVMLPVAPNSLASFRR